MSLYWVRAGSSANEQVPATILGPLQCPCDYVRSVGVQLGGESWVIAPNGAHCGRTVHPFPLDATSGGFPPRTVNTYVCPEVATGILNQP